MPIGVSGICTYYICAYKLGWIIFQSRYNHWSLTLSNIQVEWFCLNKKHLRRSVSMTPQLQPKHKACNAVSGSVSKSRPRSISSLSRQKTGEITKYLNWSQSMGLQQSLGCFCSLSFWASLPIPVSFLQKVRHFIWARVKTPHIGDGYPTP